MELLIGIEPISSDYKTPILAIELKKRGSWDKTMIARCYENYPRINGGWYRI